MKDFCTFKINFVPDARGLNINLDFSEKAMKNKPLSPISDMNIQVDTSEDTMSHALFVAIGLLLLSLFTLFMVIFITSVF